MTLQVPKVEKLMGIEVYATRCPGVGGTIRQNAEDFVVEELLVDGSRADARSLEERGLKASKPVLGSSSARGEYLLCVMAKRNWDTLSVVRKIGLQLGTGPGMIQTAGIKDAKAITAQHVTIRGASAEDLRKVRIKDLCLQPVGYLPTAISAFYLLGNSFRIIVRALKDKPDTIERGIAEAVNELNAAGGVPNFFGHQRFGTVRPITHLVGKAIVKKNLRKAAMLFLSKPSPHEHPASRNARLTLQATRDFKQALDEFPRQLRYERLMLDHLAEKPSDYAGAFRRLPSKLTELFVQAYQSYLFNRFLSARISNGLRLDSLQDGDFAVGVERSGLPLVKASMTVTPGTLAKMSDAVKAGKLKLAIPIVGYGQASSHGYAGEMEKRILEEESVSPKDFKIKDLQETSARGGLRTAVTPLNDFWVEQIAQDPTRPNRCQVAMRFMLHRGSYATVVLREIMKPKNIVNTGF